MIYQYNIQHKQIALQAKRIWVSNHPGDPIPPLPSKPVSPSEEYLPKMWLSKTRDGHKGIKYRGQKLDFYRRSDNPLGIGGKTIDSVRAHLLKRLFDQIRQITGSTTPDGDTYTEFLLPCYAHSGFVQASKLQVDHFQPASIIRARQEALVQAMNDDHEFGEKVMEYPGMEDYILDYGKDHTGDSRFVATLLFFEEYYNSVDNLWLLCPACNGLTEKADKDPIDWLKERDKQLFSNFVRQLEDIDREGILFKTQKGLGLGDAIYAYFCEDSGTDNLLFEIYRLNIAFKTMMGEVLGQMLQGNPAEKGPLLKKLRGIHTAVYIADAVAEHLEELESGESGRSGTSSPAEQSGLDHSTKLKLRKETVVQHFDTEMLKEGFMQQYQREKEGISGNED